MVQLQPSERRRFPRVPVPTPIEFQSDLGLESAVASDLSAGGMRISTRTALALGSDVWVKFKPPATLRPMFFQGRVVRLETGTQNPGELDGLAVGFVDPVGAATEELDRLVRRYLIENGLETPPASTSTQDPMPSEVVASGPKSVAIRYRTEREFVDAYTQQLCDARIELLAPEAWPVGTAVEVELELPNYYEILRLEAQIESTRAATAAGSRARGAPAEILHRARILDPTSEAMRFVHGFASVFLGSRSSASTSARAPTETDAVHQAPVALAQAAASAAPTAARVESTADAAVAGTTSPSPDTPADLTALIAEALSALDAHALDAWKAPSAGASEGPTSTDSSTAARETQRIENIADLVAKSFPRSAAPPPDPRSEPSPAPAPRTAVGREASLAAARLRVSGKSASEWAALLADEDPDQRAAAASALGKLGSTAAFAVAALAVVLDDSDPRVRRAAAWALGDIGHGASEAVPALTDRLSDADARVRWRAVRALRAIGPAASLAVPELSRALTDEDDRVRQWAETALHDLASIGAEDSLSLSSV